MSAKTNTDNQEFCQFLLENISAADFNNLHQLVGMRKHSRHTMLRVNNPRDMEVEMIHKFVALLNKDEKKHKAIDLIDRFGLGYDAMSIEQYKAFQQQ